MLNCPFRDKEFIRKNEGNLILGMFVAIEVIDGFRNERSSAPPQLGPQLLADTFPSLTILFDLIFVAMVVK